MAKKSNEMTPEEKIADADQRAGRWLADGNAFAEAVKLAKAEECYRKSSYWLDKSNQLRGNS